MAATRYQLWPFFLVCDFFWGRLGWVQYLRDPSAALRVTRLGVCHLHRAILSSRPQWRDLVQAARRPFGCAQGDRVGVCHLDRAILSSGPHDFVISTAHLCHLDRTPLSSRPQWRDLVQTARRPFDCAQGDRVG